MDKIYIDASDKYVAAVVVYGKAADSKLYVDADYTDQAFITDVEDAFVKGSLVVKVGAKVYKPVALDGVKVAVASLVSGTATVTEFSAKALTE